MSSRCSGSDCCQSKLEEGRTRLFIIQQAVFSSSAPLQEDDISVQYLDIYNPEILVLVLSFFLKCFLISYLWELISRRWRKGDKKEKEAGDRGGENKKKMK